MSHDGSSCKSYIKHPTEKERLDNLAFTSFPEDYLPYTSSYHHGREGGKAPPYLVWDERRPRKSRERRRGCCNTAALVSAIALIVTAILAVVAISVYLGVVTNLFRSPVLSLSGKFRISKGDEFSDVLLNTTSYQFLVKAETYQAMVENVFLTSSLEPAFIAARIYAFRPGMLVFFRVYLDRRKLQLDDSSVIDLVKDLVKTDSPAFGALSIDKESVDVDENEDWLVIPGSDNRLAKVLNATFQPTLISITGIKSSTTHTLLTTQRTETTKKSTPVTRRPSKSTTSNQPTVIPTAPKNPVPIKEVSRTGTGQVISIGPLSPEEDTLRFSYGQWKPVPIEDSVSPSFGDQRTPPGRGSVRLLDDVVPPPRINPPQRPPPSPSPKPSGSSLNVGVGSVRVLEDAMAHLDPIPIREARPLRPIVSEGHQRGDVASSIMSSVSLVVRKPNKVNRTLVPESGRLEMASPLEMKAGSPDDSSSNRNDHASYRFLEDLEDNASGEKTTVVDDSFFSSSTFESGDSSGGEDSLSSESSDEDVIPRQDVKDIVKKLQASFVEYVVSEKKASIPSTTVSIAEESVPAETKHSDVEILTESDNSSNSQIDSTNKTEKFTVSSDISVNKDEGHLIPLHNLNSDIGLKFLNNSQEYTDVVSTSHNIENVVSDSNLENLSSIKIGEKHDQLMSTTVQPKDLFTLTMETTTSLESVEIQIIKNDTNKTVFEPVQDKEVLAHTLNLPTTSIDINSPSVDIETTVVDNKTPESESDSTEVDLYSETTPGQVLSLETIVHSFKKLSNNSANSTLEVHTKEGHGFHKPISSSVEYFLKTDLKSKFNTEDSILTHEAELEGESSTSSTHFPDFLETNHTSNQNFDVSSDYDLIEDKSALNSSEINYSTLLATETSKPDTSDSFHETSSIQLFEKSTEASHFTSTEKVQEEDFAFESNFSSSSTNLDSLDHTIPSISNIDVDFSNESVVIQGGVPKIVPQLQDLGFNPNEIDSDDEFVVGPDNDLLENEKFDNPPTSLYHDISKEGEVEIIRHITTLSPTQFAVSLGKHPIFISNNCSDDQMQCLSGECVDLDSRCNMRRDCRDNSDEKNCSCSDLLAVMGQSQKICDGIPDCRDLSDESNCPWCGEEQVICPQTKFCINRTKICDGENDCPMGTDEKYCVKLADSVSEAHDLHYRSEGYLMVRKEGEWGKLCLDTIDDTDVLQLKMDELGKAVCSALTYRSVAKSSRAQDAGNEKENYFVISNVISSDSKKSSAIFEPSVCENKAVMRVSCNSLDCGHRPMGLAIRRRIVGGQSANSGSWPWQVALYKEGDFQCGAVLVSDIWLISAGHCFYSTQTAYWTARLGLLRRGSELPSPSEQIRRIEQIILHPNYVDKGFINDISLLRMDRPVLFSDYLRPLCLPQPSEDAGLWHGKQCSVVGWGKLYEIGHTFPDSLQEVRLPVISTEECRKKIIFLSMYHITDNMFCAGYDRGGRDACLGDSGGPLMCQRDDGRWLLLGVTSNGDGCGRPGRPGVYTKVTQYLSWIDEIMNSEYNRPSFNDTCDGVRCNLGRCIPPYKICDSRWDCSEGSDEDYCDL